MCWYPLVAKNLGQTGTDLCPRLAFCKRGYIGGLAAYLSAAQVFILNFLSQWIEKFVLVDSILGSLNGSNTRSRRVFPLPSIGGDR